MNQERLRKFKQAMDPIVALNKLEDETSDMENPLSFTELKTEALGRIKEEPVELKPQVDEEDVEQLSAKEVKSESESEFFAPTVPEWPIATKTRKDPRRFQTPTGSESYQSESAIVIEKERPQHIRKKHKIRFCVCDVCGKEFQKKSRLKNHLLTHLIKELRPQFSCSYCNSSFLSKHSKIDHEKNIHLGEKKEFKCHCGRVFAFQSSLFGHKQTAHSANTFECPECDKAYPTKYRLQQHMQTNHEPRRPCEICGKMVVGGTYYASHVRYHEKLHKCDFPGCEKVFSKATSSRYHFQATHQPREEVSCSICGTTLSNELKLKRHIFRQHRIVKVKCIFPNCEYSANYKNNLRQHYERHAGADGEWERKFQEHLSEVKFRQTKEPSLSVAQQ